MKPVLLALIVISTVIAGCNPLSAVEIPTPAPTPPPTPTMVSLETGVIRVGARTLPTSNASRWSQDLYHLQIVVDNISSEEQKAEVLAISSDGFEFVIPESEHNQEMRNNNHTIVQNVTLIPKIGDNRSYSEINFEFKQQERILSGTYNFIVQVVISGQDPIRLSVIFEVLEQYNSNMATPIGGEVPSSGEPVPTESTSPPTGCSSVYTVQRGDVLNQIARQHNTSIKRIIEVNPNKIPNPDALRIGLELCIP